MILHTSGPVATSPGYRGPGLGLLGPVKNLEIGRPGPTKLASRHRQAESPYYSTVHSLIARRLVR